MRKILGVIHARLIAEWRDGWRYWSVKLNAAGLALGGVCQIASDTWNSMPPDLRHAVPYAQGIAWALFAGGLLARFIAQPRTAEKIQAKREQRNG